MVEVARASRCFAIATGSIRSHEALTIIIVHGLEGSSESQYALGVTEKALRRA